MPPAKRIKKIAMKLAMSAEDWNCVRGVFMAEEKGLDFIRRMNSINGHLHNLTLGKLFLKNVGEFEYFLKHDSFLV